KCANRDHRQLKDRLGVRLLCSGRSPVCRMDGRRLVIDAETVVGPHFWTRTWPWIAIEFKHQPQIARQLRRLSVTPFTSGAGLEGSRPYRDRRRTAVICTICSAAKF